MTETTEKEIGYLTTLRDNTSEMAERLRISCYVSAGLATVFGITSAMALKDGFTSDVAFQNWNVSSAVFPAIVSGILGYAAYNFSSAFQMRFEEGDDYNNELTDLVQQRDVPLALNSQDSNISDNSDGEHRVF